MKTLRFIPTVAWSALGIAVSFMPAAAAPPSGLYRIIGGTYTECCGFTGTEMVYPLPDEKQSFVRLTVDPQQTTATLAVLGADSQTVFTVQPCPPQAVIPFEFPRGLVFPDHIAFRGEPRPPPYPATWDYTVSNAVASTTLTIDGVVVANQLFCSDVPTRFTHSNVVVRLVAGPKLTMLERSTEGRARIMVQGQAGWTEVIEASTNLTQWSAVSTNVMDFSLCPICPFAVFEDPVSANLSSRFYRAYETP